LISGSTHEGDTVSAAGGNLPGESDKLRPYRGSKYIVPRGEGILAVSSVGRK